MITGNTIDGGFAGTTADLSVVDDVAHNAAMTCRIRKTADGDIIFHEASADCATVVSASDAACAGVAGDTGIGKDWRQW